MCWILSFIYNECHSSSSSEDFIIRLLSSFAPETHVESVKGDIGRIVHQIRRGFIRLEDAVRGWESKEEQLKTNLEAAKSEIAETFTKYIKVGH